MLKITAVSGPLVTAKIDKRAAQKPKVLETVFVGDDRLLGEIITIDGDSVQIQVYEETTGITVGQPVELKNELLSVELGPGLLTNIFDGIQRPLEKLMSLVQYLFVQGYIFLLWIEKRNGILYQQYRKVKRFGLVKKLATSKRLTCSSTGYWCQI
jgi:vacuolar-type H+-ATPase catalytic subunit A/Vma1